MTIRARGSEPHSFPVRLVQCQLDVDHFAGVDRELADRGVASERVFPDQPPPEMGGRTKVVVISDPFAAMNALASRQARQVGASVVLVMDGVVEFRNTFINPRARGAFARTDAVAHRFLRPAPADIVACCGEIDRRVLAALGNETIATGLPRLASMRDVRPATNRRAVMVATANQPWFTEEERARVIESLRRLKHAMASMGVEAVWRLRGELDSELGVVSDRRPLREAISDVAAVITTPSTLLVESMLAGRATAILHPHPTPLWQPAAWGWRGVAPMPDEPDMSAASDIHENARRVLRKAHEEASAMTAWYDDPRTLVESLLSHDDGMMTRQRDCLALLHAETPARSAAGALAGMLECICAGDIRASGRAGTFASPVRIPAKRPQGKKPCVVSCVVCDDTPVGGVLSWSERLGDAFTARDLGYDVRTLMICVKPDAWRTGAVSVTTSDRVDLCVIDPMADHVDSLAQVRQAIENIAGGVPAVVIPNYTDITYAAAMQLRAHGARTIAVAHTDEAYYEELASTYHLWDGAVGVSRTCMDWLQTIESSTRDARTAARPLDCIPCVPPVAAKPRMVEATGPLKLAYVGRMVQVQKRISDLLLVIDGLESRGVAYELHMVGDGVDLPGWRASLARRSLKHGRVIVHGRREPSWVAEFMKTVDVSILVSEFEGTSVSMLEAMGAGVVPAVTNVRSGVSEWVTDGHTGIVVPVGAPDQMVERLAQLARDRATLARIARAAWEKAKRDASVERMADRYKALFDAVLARPLRREPTDLGLRLLERWRWNKDWAENSTGALDRVRATLLESGYKKVVENAPVPGCDAVIVRTDTRPLSRVQAEQIELWRACGLGVVMFPHLRSRGYEDAMSPFEAQTCERVRALVARAAAEGCERIAVYGTGKHTRRLAAMFDGSLPFVGFIDDVPPPWEYMFGLPIVAFDSAAEELRPDAIVLSSDAWEAKMWARTEQFRHTGVRVIPVYGSYIDPIENAPVAGVARSVAA